MKVSSEHLELATLADLVQNLLDRERKSSVLSHLSGCANCEAQFRQLESVIQLMATDDAVDAPRDVLQHALNIFQGATRSRESLVQRIVAALSFDSFTARPAFGLRSGGVAERHLIYSAAEHDIDLRISAEGDNWKVTGQLLGGDCVPGEVALESKSATVSTQLNDVCEFSLPPVASGNYTLRVRLANLEVEVPRLELRA